MRQDYENDEGEIIYGYPDEHPYYDDEPVEPGPETAAPPRAPGIATGGTTGNTPKPNPAPNPDPRTGGGGPDLGPLLQTYGGQFQRPQFGIAAKQLMDLIGPTPEFIAPSLPQIDDFSYESFAEPEPFAYADYTPTSAQDVLGDPSYGFRKGVGEKALLNNRAAQGLTRSGGTLKDLLDYNQNFASQEFGNVDARRYRDYNTGRGNAMDTYGTNLKTKFDTYGTNRANAFGNWSANKDKSLGLYDRGFEAERAQFEPKLYGWNKKADLSTRAEERAYDNAFDEFQTDYSMWRQGNEDIFNKLKWSSEFGLDAATR